MTATLAAPQVVDGMPEAEYHAHLALSSTNARKLLNNPARYRYEREHPTVPTREMILGTCVHTEVLGVGQGWGVIDPDDPDMRADVEAWALANDCAVLPEGDGRTKAVRQAKAAIEAVDRLPLKFADAAAMAFAARGLIVLTEAEAAMVRGMAAEVRRHPEAGPLLAAGAGIPERSLFWTDPATGVECRARLDWYLHSGRGIVDLKTTGDASPAALPRHMEKFGYHTQAGHYLDGAEACGIVGPDAAFVWVFVERTPPHFVTVADLIPADLAEGRAQARLARQILRDCTESGVWPGYPEHIVTISLPPWTRRSHDIEEHTSW